MGIRGLTSYIAQNADRFHQPHQLYDSSLVIDGSSLACQLYIRVSACNSAYGGDYDKYSKTIEDFFSLLWKCNVTPFVILDGGYEQRKLKTVWKRLKSKIHNASVCNPSNHKSSSVFPLLMWDVFKQVMRRLGIKFAQSDFEADHEIAAIARHLNCPVLSYDSDFYVFDVLYIPFSTLNLAASMLKSDGSVKYFVRCELFKVDHFLSNFGGLDKSLLPLMATLLGNDYVPGYIYSKFYNHVKLPKSKKMTEQQRRIKAIFEWLRKETLSSAVSKILNHLQKGIREHVKKQIDLAYAGYSCYHSELLPYLGLPSATSCVSPSFEENAVPPSPDLDSVHFPTWLEVKFRKGDIPSFVSDIFYLHIYICQPQVEDFTLNDSHGLSFPILKLICGLLFSEVTEKLHSPAKIISCYSRGAGNRPQKLELEPTLSLLNRSLLPSLSSLPQLPLFSRQSILANTLGIISGKDIDILESFGDSWKLFAYAVVFWARTASSPNVSNCHLHAVIICMIALGVIDKKLGRIRTQKEYQRRKSDNLLAKSENESSQGSEMESENSPTTVSHQPLDKICSQVSEKDCLCAVDSLLQFHLVDKIVDHQFSVSPLHVFAQLQACLFMTMSLNSILDNPFPECYVSEIYSGSVVYTAFANFNKRRDVEAYISTLLTNAPSILHVFKNIAAKFGSLLPNLPVLYRKAKKRKKRKQDQESVYVPEITVSDSDRETHQTLDINNKFSALLLL